MTRDDESHAEPPTPLLGVAEDIVVEPQSTSKPSVGLASDYMFSLPGSNGRGVLLIHGLTGAPDEMRYLSRQLNSRGYSVHVPVMAGHGGTGSALLRTGWKDWVASMVAAYDKLAAQCQEVYVAGICVGGLVGVELARHRPAIKGLAVYSPTFDHDGWSLPKWYRAGRRLRLIGSLPIIRNIHVPEAPPYGIKNERLRGWIANTPNLGIEGALDSFPLGALSQQYALANHIIRSAGSVRTPTLIIHAVDDDQSLPRNAERLRGVLAGPTQLEWLHNSYHMVHVDQQRGEVARLTSDFFARQAA